jgi:hypothetical protein
MYLKSVKSKGNIYIYLCAYNNQEQDKKILFSFGRIDKAIKNMYEWEKSELPVDLIEIGCSREELFTWIKKVKEINKTTTRKMKSII